MVPTLGNCNAKVLVPAPKIWHVTEQPPLMLMSRLSKGKICLHLYSERASAWEPWSWNAGGEDSQSWTENKAGMQTKWRQWSSKPGEGQLVGERGWGLPTDRGNTAQYLRIRAGHPHPKRVLVLQQNREAWSQLVAFLFGGLWVKPILHSVRLQKER